MWLPPSPCIAASFAMYTAASMHRSAGLIVLVTLSVTLLGCATRARRPDGPFRVAQELADALSDDAVACTREHAPSGTGNIVVAAELTGAGKVPLVTDAGSMPGSEAVIACVRARAIDKLRCPERAPARFVVIRVPVPLVTKNVTYAFSEVVPQLPLSSDPAASSGQR
jgi:hypothetical protein